MKRRFQTAGRSNSALRTQKTRKIGFEQCEARQMMSVTPAVDASVFNGSAGPLVAQPYDPPARLAEGSINFNSANGTLTIEGSETRADTINVYINHRAGHGAGDLPDLLTISLANSAGQPQTRVFNIGEVRYLNVNTHGGNDFLDNRTWIPMTANGGDGNDVLMGGYDADSIRGGNGSDFIDGRLGDDLLFGEAGNDKLFGDDGFDSLLGGDGNDFLFGGNGDDSIYGEAGNDVIFGELGKDRLVDSLGKNSMVADYGGTPSRIPTITDFRQFYAFDKNFNDPALRSLARLSYRDMTLSRTEVMGIFNLAATNGVESILPFNGSVSTSEFHDLKNLLSTSWPLHMSTDVRYLANAVVNGNSMNAHYQSSDLGNLKAGVRGDHLTHLVDKWFKGGDLPAVDGDGLSTLHYQYVSGSLFVNGPSHSDIDQGSVNTCYLLAALGEVADRSPSTIRHMFIDNGDGTFGVRFFIDGKSVFTTVNRMLPAYGNGFDAPFAAGWGSYADEYGMVFQRLANDPMNELWVGLAEKAYAQLNESGKIGQDGTNSYPGIEFGYTSTAFKQITNHSASDHSPSSQSDFLKAVNAGKAITLSTKDSHIAKRIVTKHAYMLVGYDSTTGEFELYNPHGPNASESQPMTIFVTWNEIKDNFKKWTSVAV